MDSVHLLGISPAPQLESGDFIAADLNLAKFTEISHRYALPIFIISDSKLLSRYSEHVESAWQYKCIRDKFSHLLKNPLCICGSSTTYFAKSKEDTLEIGVLFDTFREIDPNRWTTNLCIDHLEHVEFEQRLKLQLPPISTEEDEFTVRAADHEIHRNILPRLIPAAAHQMMALLQNADQLIREWHGRADDRSKGDPFVDHPVAMWTLVRLIYEEQILYNALFYETIRQCTVQFLQRGHFLMKLRKYYIDLLSRVPVFMMNVHNECLVRRSVERRMMESFVGYKLWWDSMQFKFEQFREAAALGENIHQELASTEPLPDQDRLVVLLDNDGHLFKGYTRLFATHRSNLLLDQQDMNYELDLWQELTNSLSADLLRDSEHACFKSLLDIETAWNKAANIDYQSIEMSDQRQSQQLRETTKQWLEALNRVHKRLIDNEMEVVRVLKEMREGIMDAVRRYNDREGPHDLELAEDIPANVRNWIAVLNETLSRFQADEADMSVKYPGKMHLLFDQIVKQSIVMLLGRYHRECSISATPEVSSYSDSVRILESTEPDHFVRHPTVYTRLFEDLDRAKRAQEDFYPTSTFRPRLTDQEFDRSVEFFAQYFRGNREPIDLHPIRHSRPYAILFQLAEEYTHIKASLYVRIFGDEGLPLEMSALELKLEHLYSQTVKPGYFIGPEPGRFSSTAYSFVDEIDRIVRSVKDRYVITRLHAIPRNDNVTQFRNTARTWYLFFESHLEATTKSLLKRVHVYAEHMLKLRIRLLAIVLPDQTFDEQRYLSLYKTQTPLSISDQLDLLELQSRALCREMLSFSNVIDHLGAQNDEFEDTQKDGATNQVENLDALIGKILNLAIDKSGTRLMHHEGSAWSRYSEKVSQGELRIERNEFDMGELLKLLDENVEREDFVELHQHGTKVNIYIKPFNIATQENVDRENDPMIREYISTFRSELEAEADLNRKTDQRIDEINECIRNAKEVQERLDADVKRLRVEQKNGQPVQSKYADVPMDQMAILATTELPDIMKPGPVHDIPAMVTLPKWDDFIKSNVPDSPFGDEQTRPPFDFAEKMRSLRDSLRGPKEELEQFRAATEPKLVVNYDKRQHYHHVKVERDHARSDRQYHVHVWLNARAKARAKDAASSSPKSGVQFAESPKPPTPVA